MIKPLIALLGTLLLSACQISDPLSAANDPKNPWWSLEFVGPVYMTSWVEDSLVEDIHDRVFNHGSAGVVGSGSVDYGHATDLARGWPNGLSASSGVRGVVGAGLPKRIFVRWQSVVEPQTYRAWVDIPEHARQILHNSTAQRCPATPNEAARYRGTVYLGLAPGGIVQVWVRDNCSNSIKVARAQAEIEPLGPHLGQSEGHYYPQSDFSKRYIDAHGIPYGSW